MSDCKFTGTNGINMDELHKALNQIPVSTTTRDEWLKIGSALKFEGAPLDWFIEWSSTDSRPGYFSEENCRGRWESFKRTAAERHTTAKTIFYAARAAGYKSSAKSGERRPVPKIQSEDKWKPKLADVSGYVVGPDLFRTGDTSKDWDPVGQTIQYLEALFDPGDTVNIMTGSRWDEKKEKWNPIGWGTEYNVDDLLTHLYEIEDGGIEKAIGEPEHTESGIWIRINPVDGKRREGQKGIEDANVAAFRWALVEFDDLPIEEQLRAFHELRLPVRVVVHSGGKSAHAVVHIDAASEAEYRERVVYLHDVMARAGRKCDAANKNPSRLSRLPGAMRGDRRQYIVEYHPDTQSWDEWFLYMDRQRRRLPTPVDLEQFDEAAPELPPPLIDGILRVQGKLMIAAASKAHKSFLVQHLALCLANGVPWLGHRCQKVPVLYVNTELDEVEAIDRFHAIKEAAGFQTMRGVHVMSTRLYNEPLTMELAEEIATWAREYHAGCVVVDPVYKLLSGDENKASDMAAFVNALDRIAVRAGAAVVFVHHFPKGASDNKTTLDKASGSGVFARDAHAVITLERLDAKEANDIERPAGVSDTAKPWRMEFAVRSFPDLPKQSLWWSYPLYHEDRTGLLSLVKAAPSPQQQKKQENIDDLERILCDYWETHPTTAARESEPLTKAELMNRLHVKDRTLSNYLREIPYVNSNKYGRIEFIASAVPPIGASR